MKIQKIETKAARKNLRAATKQASVRLQWKSKERAKLLLKETNSKAFGRNIKLDELLDVALSLVQNEHIKMLQERSKTNEDRKEELRQRYIEKFGPISKEEFTGFMMTADFYKFVSEHSS